MAEWRSGSFQVWMLLECLGVGAWFKCKGRGPLRRCALRRSAPVRVAALVALCLIGVGVLAGCASSVSHGRRRPGRVGYEPGPGEDGYEPVEYAMRHGLTLARGRLPDGGFFTIIVKHCFNGDCSELDEYGEEPARYSGLPHSVGLVKQGGATGPEVGRPGVPRSVQRRARERVRLTLSVLHECAGPYPTALSYGLLYSKRDEITVHADGRTVKFKKVTIPARFHPLGVLVYALLLPGRNEQVVREPDGRVVERESLEGAKANESCQEAHG